MARSAVPGGAPEPLGGCPDAWESGAKLPLPDPHLADAFPWETGAWGAWADVLRDAVADGWPEHPAADAGKSAAPAQDVRARAVQQNPLLQQKRKAMPT